MPVPRISNPQELATLRLKLLDERKRFQSKVLICTTGCRALGGLELGKAFREKLSAAGSLGEIAVVDVGCHGHCARAPVVLIEPQEYVYGRVTPADVDEIIQTTLREGKPVKRLCEKVNGKTADSIGKVPFYRSQKREVFKHCGRIDPKLIEDAIACGTYEAVAKALSSLSPEQVIEEISGSGLRGRGGAGFPTGKKWSFCRKAAGAEKYLICNADEGDPGAFMDRALLEGAPHQVLEGMLIAAYAIGATHGFVYVRAEYPIAVEHVGIAIEQARACGLLGANIMGSGFSFDLDVRMGAGAFVCGEETALIASLEGHRGMPRPRPPFPVEKGYLGKPTTINNVETFGNVPLIIARGKEWFGSIGTPGSKGTKVFALAGKVHNTGLVEVPMGATLRQIVYDVGGGIPRDRKFKAAQMGGPSGGCVPARYLDLPIDYDTVKQVGAIMGSGGLIIMDESICMVDIARFFTDFVQKESCGKCVPCRVGTTQMLTILNRITNGEGKLSDIDELISLGEAIRDSSLCGLGQTAPNPVLSTIRHFRHEYEAHIIEKRCPAHVCEHFVPASCISACPAHVNVPEYVALTAEGRFVEALDIIRRRNPFPSVCGRSCDHPCEKFCRRGDMDHPVGIRHLKRFVSDIVKDVGTPPAWVGPREGRIAVIGSGPAGLTAAYFLALMGREVKVFEKDKEPGGLLMSGLPMYRLPRKTVERDIEYIRRAGVEIKTDHKIQSLQELHDAHFDAIIVAVGAHKGLALNISGEQTEGVQDALAFLRRTNLGEIKQLGGQVVVIGGGNAAIDSARVALRIGADSVTLLYRRTAEEMPAIREEVEEAVREGVKMRFLVAPVAIEGNGRVRSVKCAEMTLGEADENGRRIPVPKPGGEVVVPADHVIVAIGQEPDIGFAHTPDHLTLARGRIVAQPATQRCGSIAVFAGGDAVTGPSTIIEAIGAGQRAAQAVDIYLGGAGELPMDTGIAPRIKPGEESAAIPHQEIKAVSLAKRKGTFEEVLKGYSTKAARAEAHRCLRCDLE